jgi:soluble lytic murein transglycosylase-like protein
MKSVLILAQMLGAIAICGAQSGNGTARIEAEYYVAVYAEHYRVPVALVRAIVQQESNWQACPISAKGAVGLMQLMPITAQRLGVTTDLCNPGRNVSGGVRHLAWLLSRFHNDLRLVAAAYYAGEDRILKRGLSCRDSDVVAYVSSIRTAYLRETAIEPGSSKAPEKGDVR